MAIEVAIQKDDYVRVYGNGNRELFSKRIYPSNGDALMGFTSTTVSIKQGDYIRVYDERLNEISSHRT